MIVEDLKLVFVHIPRTAGSSMEQAICQKYGRDYAAARTKDIFHMRSAMQHANWAKMKKLYRGHEPIGEYFRFAFVRNPWDRLVSCFHFGKTEFDQGEFNKYVAITHRRVTTGDYQHGEIIGPCVDFTHEEGKQIVHFVGRFEQLGVDWLKISAKNGLMPLNHVNKSQAREDTGYRSYYNEHTCRMVAEAYAEDIETFGYEF